MLNILYIHTCSAENTHFLSNGRICDDFTVKYRRKRGKKHIAILAWKKKNTHKAKTFCCGIVKQEKKNPVVYVE